jgi:hypothetical protein
MAPSSNNDAANGAANLIFLLVFVLIFWFIFVDICKVIPFNIDVHPAPIGAGGGVGITGMGDSGWREAGCRLAGSGWCRRC